MKRLLIAPVILLLAGCGSADNDPGPGGVSVGEARALDEAAEMIEAKRLPQQGGDDENELSEETRGQAKGAKPKE